MSSSHSGAVRFIVCVIVESSSEMAVSASEGLELLVLIHLGFLLNECRLIE